MDAPTTQTVPTTPTTPTALRLHHHAFVVRDQEVTRHFYEDVLGFPLVATWCERESLRGKVREYCHTFFGLADGSALAFFQMADPADHAELAASTPASLNHVALAVTAEGQAAIEARLTERDVPFRVIDHGYCRSLYLADPDGMALEFTVDAPDVAAINELRRDDAHRELARWLAGDRTPNNDLR
jgi:catechol 2,3-dioxygenase-like lactoylglutathione lyase family enzyme